MDVTSDALDPKGITMSPSSPKSVTVYGVIEVC